MLGNDSDSSSERKPFHHLGSLQTNELAVKNNSPSFGTALIQQPKHEHLKVKQPDFDNESEESLNDLLSNNEGAKKKKEASRSNSRGGTRNKRLKNTETISKINEDIPSVSQ